MYETGVNATMVFAMLFTLLENHKIYSLEFDCSEYKCGVPYFTIRKNGKEYCLEVTLGDEYSIYDYDDYFGGLGIPLYTGNVFDLNYYIANKL